MLQRTWIDDYAPVILLQQLRPRLMAPKSIERFRRTTVDQINSTNGLYFRLSSNEREIRGCRVDRHSADVCCVLKVARLDSVNGYKCLSYVWGDYRERENIVVNGITQSVTANLYVALQFLRKRLDGDAIWIDALCINQDDLEERKGQVAMMGDIYRQSTEVWIWLASSQIFGRSFSEDATCGGYIERKSLQAGIDLLFDLANNGHFHELPYFGKCASSDCFSSGDRPTKPWAVAIESLGLLMASEWFQRTWTIQEVVLAKHAVAIHGHYSVEWSIIRQAMAAWNCHMNECCSECMLALSKADFRVMQEYAQTLLDIEHARWSMLNGENILHPLLKFRSKKVSNKRDKIFQSSRTTTPAVRRCP